MQFQATNLYTLLPQMIEAFKREGYRRPSRNGDVIRLPGVTTVELTRPHQRVCVLINRDANPFFHLIEAMAMLAGKNSNRLLRFFASNMDNFSDDGLRYNAFYGERARTTWGDQLQAVIKQLTKDPATRQAVVNLWDPADLLRDTKDRACNLCMIFWAEDGVLHMTTFNRSNDCVWGFLTGANMVHFPFFHEYVAAMCSLSMGSWHHVSNNMHVYGWNKQWDKLCNDPDLGDDPYCPSPGALNMRAERLIEDSVGRATFDRDLADLVDRMAGIVAMLPEDDTQWGNVDLNRLLGYLWVDHASRQSFLYGTVTNVFAAFVTQKVLRKTEASPDDPHWQNLKTYLECIQASDWKVACQEWVNRRLSK